MTDHKPWTFLPFEAEESKVWTVFDDNVARIVAVFYDKTELDDYLAWRNRKQAKRSAKAERKAARKAMKLRQEHHRAIADTIAGRATSNPVIQGGTGGTGSGGPSWYSWNSWNTSR